MVARRARAVCSSSQLGNRDFFSHLSVLVVLARVVSSRQDDLATVAKARRLVLDFSKFYWFFVLFYFGTANPKPPCM